MSKKNRKLLILSGSICRNHSLVLTGQINREIPDDLRRFWSGFINIQRELNIGEDKIDIIAHSWNPKYDKLIQQVYSPKVYLSEDQNDFSPEFMSKINPIDRFEQGFKRSKSLYERVTPQSVIGQSRSRSKATGLIKKINTQDYSQAILLRWDHGLSGTRNVNTLVYDKALPEEYLYMAYMHEMDEGYADMWLVAPLDIMLSFSNFDEFVFECLSGKNKYLEEFTKTGWPLSLKTKNSFGKLKQVLRFFFVKFPEGIFIKFVSIFGNYIKYKFVSLFKKLRKYIYKPVSIGEMSIELKSKDGEMVYPTYAALNNHALLKYFILKKNLRDRARFLEPSDFKKLKINNGKLINPIEFPLVIYSHSSYNDCWEMVIKQAEKFMPTNCTSIILLSEESENSQDIFNKLKLPKKVELKTYQDSQTYTERLRTSFENLSKKWEILYFIHEDMPLYAPVDGHYLNALLHYFSNSQEFYIKLIDTTSVDEKFDHPVFPDLKWNAGGYSMSIHPSLIKTQQMIDFFKNFNCSIYDFENLCNKSYFKASSVAGQKLVGKYALINERFPHIVTSISKGKWTVSEWPNEIGQLTKKYRINTKLRGTV
jgi:hypothetical protein